MSTGTANNNNATAPANQYEDIWGMEASNKSGGGDFEACPAGTWSGTIIGLFDIGTHSETYQGKPKDVRQLVLVCELKKKQTNGEPFIMGDKFGWSLGKKSKIRPVAESVLHKSFDDGERFDPRELVGLPCMVNVKNVKSGDGTKTYANIETIRSLSEEMEAPKPTKPLMVWSVLEGKPFPAEHAEWLPYIYGSTIEDLANESREIRGSQKPASGNSTSVVDPGPDDDIPF